MGFQLRIEPVFIVKRSTKRVEDAEHVILKCPLYDDLRRIFLCKIEPYVEGLTELPSADPIIVILSQPNIAISSAKYLQKLLWRRRLNMCQS